MFTTLCARSNAALYLRGGLYRAHRRSVHIEVIGCNGVVCGAYAPLTRILEERGYSTSCVDLADCGGDWFRAFEKVEKAPLPSSDKVVGFGHSMGGACLMRAARNKAYDRVLVWDAPMFGLVTRIGLALIQTAGLVDFMPEVRKWRRRPSNFQSREETTEYVMSRDYYKSFHPLALQAFLECGVRQDGSWVFTPEDEVNFFVTTPTDLIRETHGIYAKNFTLPGTFWYSEKHEFVRPRDIRYLRSHFDTLSFKHVPSHFYPLQQDPAHVADMIEQELLLS